MTNPIAKMMIGKGYYIYYDESYDLRKNNSYKYKKDSRGFIYILNKAIKNELSVEKNIISDTKYLRMVKVKKNKYEWQYISKNKMKSFGYLIVSNNEFLEFYDKKRGIKVKKN